MHSPALLSVILLQIATLPRLISARASVIMPLTKFSGCLSGPARHLNSLARVLRVEVAAFAMVRSLAIHAGHALTGLSLAKISRSGARRASIPHQDAFAVVGLYHGSAVGFSCAHARGHFCKAVSAAHHGQQDTDLAEAHPDANGLPLASGCHDAAARHLAALSERAAVRQFCWSDQLRDGRDWCRSLLSRRTADWPCRPS